MNPSLNSRLKLAFDYVQYTGKHIFLTGKAGTGKTTFLHNLKKSCPKRMIVVAPTGVAAVNAGGVTVHSFFQLPFGPIMPGFSSDSEGNPRRKEYKFSRDKLNIIKSLDLLVIDEISMVRADLLDGIDEVLRRFRDKNKPFGGVQLLMIGDLQQLAPVVKNDEWDLLRKFYDSEFFFSSRALKQTEYVTIELQHIYRQSDQDFIELLNRIRDNTPDDSILEKINSRYFPNFNPHENEGYITLTTHNAQAQEMNEAKLKKLEGTVRKFRAEVNGNFPEYSYPTDFELTLKRGAQVMFVKNDTSNEKLFFNGKIGKVTGMDDDFIYVRCPGEENSIAVEKMQWENNRYTIDEKTQEITETIEGTFIQYPLKLAWAITIHKSQGLTFDKAIIDANAAFAFGQVYVALSRCRTLEGLVLSSRISNRSIISNKTVSQFNQMVEQNHPGGEELESSKKEYQKNLLFELFDFSLFQKRLNYLLKLIRENESVVFGNIREESIRINQVFSDEMIGVGEKFQRQLDQILVINTGIEDNPAIQERVKKACPYFMEKLNRIIQLTGNMYYESDNSSVKKSVKEVLFKLEEELKLKSSCLKSCENGFFVTTYLQAKARGVLSKNDEKKRKKQPEISSAGIPHPVLYETIKKWRNNKANELGLPAYMVLPEKTILQLVHFLPSGIAGLLKIKGFGSKKTKQYGEEILGLLTDFCKESGLTPVEDEKENESEQEVKEKKNTRQISFDLFREGRSIEEIAAERGMAVSTIEGHLSHYIGTGELNILHFVKPEKISEISDFFIKKRTNKLSEAKEFFGESVSWSDLKFVLKHLEYSGLLNDVNA